MELFKRDNLIYSLIGISSCITYLFGQHAYLPQVMKIILGLSNFAAAGIMIRRNIEATDSDVNPFRKISIFLVIYAGISLFISIVHAPGRFQTFIFSPFYLLAYLLPLFYLLVDDQDFFKKFLKLYLIVSIVSLISMRGFGLACFLIVLFYPILVKQKKFIILFGILLFYDLIWSFNILGTLKDAQRQTGLELVFAAITVYFVWIKGNIKVAKILTWIFCILPIVIWGLFLIYKISVFELFSERMDDAVMRLDTRTFLYIEFMSNIHSLQDWILGFGIDGGYYSYWFGSDPTTGGRETIEVTMLHLILKGGLLLLFSYVVIIVKGIITGFKEGQNKLVYACCMMLSGHLVCMCMGDYPSRSLLIQIIPFIMVGICTNERILSLDDEDLENILELE